MAYVAISNQLLDEVRSKINRMKEAEVNSIPEVTDNLAFNYVPTDFEKLVWGEHYHLKDAIPSSWKRSVSELCGYTEYEHNGRTIKTRLFIKLGTKVGVPPDQNSYTAHFPISETHPDVAPVVARDKQVDDINTKWNAIHTKLRDFLKNIISEKISLNMAVNARPMEFSTSCTSVVKRDIKSPLRCSLK